MGRRLKLSALKPLVLMSVVLVPAALVHVILMLP